ncbi:MAG TPA: efflux RND transporter periplasmic adaptor subunit [Steroidobacteraceae bacterium]|nr:efflux RND transporter periplasmic adaptor subunit [Steroidobacteraceae bacterium]
MIQIASSGAAMRLIVPLVALHLGLGACSKAEPPVMPPLEVAVMEVQPRDIPIYLEMVGQTFGSVDIPISARVDGVLEEMHFLEGRPVKKGQLLYVIDATPYESRVVEARGRLAEARTRLAKAGSDLERIRPLAEMDAVSQQDLDGAVAQFEAARGALQAAEAQVEQAGIQLGYTRISAPVDGLIGITQAKIGEYVGRAPNPVVLNVVSQTNPIRVRFAINEREYLRFSRELSRSMRELDERQKADKATLQLMLADGTIHEHPGDVVAFDAAVDPNTGTLTLEADFPNPDRIVLPGQFARVRGVMEQRKGALAVPQRAVMEAQGLFRLAVVADDGVVELRRVGMGPRVDGLWIVESGLKAGERVALEGLQRLRTGMQVAPKEAQSRTGQDG